MSSPERPLTTIEAVRGLLVHPYEQLIRQWNWKSAVLSALIRSGLFFLTNLRAGAGAAVGAAAAELVFRACTSGFYGAITQAFVPVRPVYAATLTAGVMLPLVSHTLEFLVHYLRGTPELSLSVVASVTFTGCSTAFNLFAMRRGALIVGKGRQSIAADLRRMPRLICLFIASIGDVRRWTEVRGRCR